ncbi:MAG: hypothetical protein AAGG09_05940 [Pseudomonadota bacterium]
MHARRLLCSLSVAALTAGGAAAEAPQYASVLEFGLDDTLFVADSAAGTVFAYDLPDVGGAPVEDAAYNLLDVDGAVEAALGADPRTVIYSDLAVHPVTRDAYVSVTYRVGESERSAVVSLDRDGSASVLDIQALTPSTFSLQDVADSNVSFWRDIPAPTLTVTDLDYVDGELFVSGLSTGEFASTLRRVPFPFGEAASSTSIEMYHAAHGQNETRAPIRAMTVVDLGGSPTVVAAYTCTPLVTLPVSDLQDGTHVTGKTIAELGYGNTPLEVIAFSAPDLAGNVGSYVLVVNREMDADLIAMDALTEAAASPGLSAPIPYLGATAGVATTPLPLSGVLHAADQDNTFLLAMRRDLDTGAMQLVSFRKGAFFRLSDFISEYNFPDYIYADNQMSQGTRMFQNLLKADEGFPDQAR